MITKQELLDTCQLSINMYEGKYGKVVELLDSKVFEKVNGISLCTGWKDHNFYIIFEGTDGTDEWVENFNIYKKDVPYYTNANKKIKAHLGFLNHYRTLRTRVWEIITQNLGDICANNSIIYITGHSLGGATATLCADDVKRNIKISKPKIKVIPHEAPRVFNRYGANEFDKRFVKNTDCEGLRVVYRNDSVPKVPPRRLLFKHCLERLWLEKPAFSFLFKHPCIYIKGLALDHEPVRELNALRNINK
jgi:predicted lipase